MSDLSTGRVVPFPRGKASEMDNASLVRGLSIRDPEAVQTAWVRFSPMVDRMARRMLGPGHEPEDMVQEVFLRLFRRIHTLREPAALPAFIMAITSHAAQAEMRRQWIRRLLTKQQAILTPETTGTGPDDDAREGVARLYQHLSKLSAQDRIAFTLRFVEGMDLGEMAEVLGVSLATTKRRVAHASKRLAHRMRTDPTLAHYIEKGEQG